MFSVSNLLELSRQMIPDTVYLLELSRQMTLEAVHYLEMTWILSNGLFLLIAIPGTIDLGWRTWIRMVETSASGDSPLIGIVWTTGFGSELLIGVARTIEF